MLAAAVSGEQLKEATIESGDDWLTFTNMKFLGFSRPGGNVESFTIEFEDVEIGHGAAGRPALSPLELTRMSSTFEKPLFSNALAHRKDGG